MNFKNINMEKGMYHVPGKSFTQVLESLDNSQNYRGTELECLDAYQRQLKRYDIKVAGSGSDRVEKFFATTSSTALFPEYVARAVRQGMEQANRLSDMVATVTNIDSLDYRSVKSSLTSSELDMTVVDEGDDIPEVTIKSAENLVTLKKRGSMLTASYEALRFQKLDLFTVTLKQIGAHIATTQMNDAVSVLLAGDGNSNPITTTTLTSDMSYGDMVNLWASLSPYNLNTILAGTDVVQKLLALEEFKDSQAGLTFHGTGNIVTPLGATLIHIPTMASGKIIGLDKNYALEMVTAGDVLTEYDKLIDSQIERAVISSIAGFAKIYDAASACIEYTEEDDSDSDSDTDVSGG